MSDTTDGPGDDPIGNDPHADAVDETTALASAYLDDAVTADERARVEASPELMAAVDELRDVRTVLGAAAEPPPISVREAHLAAALDVWDRMSISERAGDVTPDRGVDAAAAAAITTPASTAPRRDRRGDGVGSRWFLGAAAGFVVLAGAGLVIRSAIDSGDDDSDFAASSAADEAPAEEASEPEIIADAATDAFEGVEAESAPLSVAEDVAFSEDERSAVDADDAMEETPAEEPADDSGDAAMAAEEEAADEAMEEVAESDDAMASDDTVAPGGEADPFPPEIDLDELVTIEELQEFAATVYYAPIDTDAPAVEVEPPFATCDEEFAPFFTLDQIVGPAAYVDQEVIVAITDDASPDVVAYLPTECELVEQAPLPTLEEYEAGRSEP